MLFDAELSIRPKDAEVMKWEAADVIRLVALIGALILFFVGAFMMWQGIAAEGAIDIKTSVLTGSIKTGSAGLFISFLAFVVIVFVLSSLFSKSPIEKAPNINANHTKSTRVVKLLAALFIGLVLFGVLAALNNGNGFAALAMAFGLMFFLTSIVYFTFLEQE